MQAGLKAELEGAGFAVHGLDDKQKTFDFGTMSKEDFVDPELGAVVAGFDRCGIRGRQTSHTVDLTSAWLVGWQGVQLSQAGPGDIFPSIQPRLHVCVHEPVRCGVDAALGCRACVTFVHATQ